ncbi:hypothetical protein CBS63078_5393 [Aspergillus niger]|nr:hypothetical protein CBS115989_4281 [Aspergillus niger]KAI2827723.1 hypothetical protein CBS133816_6162 [Aspergillus niger]KAI2836399.1 hypothetical protein CBS11350_9407 [Aspergillus niger]KAI2855409.1 hypothetical protein CBS11232_4444 [Aspergillus niger]KAI2866756.1 hypothetical protein CBS12448_1052 [Aspergillus niger]
MDFLQQSPPSAQDLLRTGEPFVPFSEYSVQDITHLSEDETTGWVETKLRDGKPFVIRGFSHLKEWDRSILNNERLGSLSSSAAIPVRNCHTGRDAKMRLQDLLSQTECARAGNVREFLYAKDLQCPQAWIKALEAFLPSAMRHLGSLDLFRMLPKETAPEVLMAYVGTRKSSSGFHRCFSGTVALNLLVESEGAGPGSLCFGTDKISQAAYDTYMERLGKSPHTDWTDVSTTQLKSADFPIYVTHQHPGDLVIFPSATAHQIWNISSMVTKVVWNVMHSSSLVSFFDYIQPFYQRYCHADTGRVPLIPLHALIRGSLGTEDEALLLDVFLKLLDDEAIETDSDPPMKIVDTQGAVVECNFCGLTIWNRHLHCEQCGDFDLCLTCFITGRSCKHVADYTWAELIPRAYCMEVIQSTRNRLRDRLLSRFKRPKQKSLGALAAAAADARKQPMMERLCHLCRDSHPAWKGVACTQCSAFFCFRGLHRHFDVDLIPFLRNTDPWPVRARIKSIDPRGRIMGFTDNVFDQKRGKRASMAAHSASLPPEVPSRAHKRPRNQVSDEETELPRQQEGSSTFTNRGIIQSHSTEDTIHSSPRPYVMSSRSIGPKGQLRISDLVEKHSPAEAEPPFPAPFRHASPLLSLTPGDGAFRRPANEPSVPATTDEASISFLERKLEELRRYADELLDLSLVDSHAKVLEKIGQLQGQIEERKRRKAEALFDSLDRDFPELATVAREEARRRGLLPINPQAFVALTFSLVDQAWPRPSP